MWYDTYQMGWKANVTKQRYHDYRAGLMDYNEIAVLYQDLIEKECLPAQLVDAALHFIQMGLVRLPDQMPYN
jgi:hypothetical protein